MGTRALKVAAAAATMLAIQAATAETVLPDGLYEVSYRLDLPHLETREEKVRTVCLRDVGRSALPVLSANNPLAGCPSKNLRREGDDLAFDIVCPGGGAARASALFQVADGRFQGSIAMTMGGKNMTMTEVQRGRRTGNCADGAPAAPGR